MLVLRPWLRLLRFRGEVHLEALLRERAVPADDLLVEVLRALAGGPLPSAKQLRERLTERGVVAAPSDVRAALSLLDGLGLLGSDDLDEGSARALIYDELARGAPPAPIVDQVELTNTCPMRCVMCPTGTGAMTRPRGFMDRVLFARVVDEIVRCGQQLKPLTLHNLGESLLHPELPDLVRIASERGLETEVSGNPGHLPIELYRALQGAGLTRLVLSLDGLDKETLEAVRGKGARGDRAFANVDALLAHRREHPRARPEVVLQMIAQPLNAHQHEAFVARYAGLGLPGVEAYVKQLDANTDVDGERLYHLNERPRAQLCRAPWKSVVVLWDGAVIACCHDENGALTLGNLREQRLDDIWRSPAAEALRQRLREGALDGDEPCATCAHRADRYRLPRLDEIPVEPLTW